MTENLCNLTFLPKSTAIQRFTRTGIKVVWPNSVEIGLNRESKGQVSATGRALERLGWKSLQPCKMGGKKVGLVSVCIGKCNTFIRGITQWSIINSFDSLGLRFTVYNKHSLLKGQLNLHPWLGCFWPRYTMVDLQKSYIHNQPYRNICKQGTIAVEKGF